MLYALPANGTDLVCVDDSAGCMPRPDRPDHADGSILTDVAIPQGPGLYWLIMDGFNGGDCGAFVLDTNLR